MATIDASAYPNIGAAMAASSVGGRLYVPSGSYTAPAGGLVISGSFEIDMEPQAIISAASTTDPVIDIQLPSNAITDRVFIHGGKLLGPGSAFASGGYGIKCVMPVGTTGVTAFRNLIISELSMSNMGDHGIYLKGNNASTGHGYNNFEFPVIRNVMIENGFNFGMFWQNGGETASGPVTAGLVDTVFFNNHESWGSVMQACECVFINSYWEENADSDAGTGQCSVANGQYSFYGNHFEDFAVASTASGAARGIVADNCQGLTVLGTDWTNSSEDTSHAERCAVYISGSNPCHTIIGPGRLSNVTRFTDFAVATSKMHIYEQFVVNGGQPVYNLPAGVHLKAWN